MKKLFSKYVHSTCNPEEASAVIDYLKNKANDPEIISYMEPYWKNQLSNDEEEPKTNPSLFKRIIREINYADNLRLNKKLKLYKTALKIAAVLVVGLIIGSSLLVNNFSSQNIAKDVRHIKTPYGVKTDVSLPDGSVMWINSGSNASFPGKFGKSRNIKLAGEAFFDVKESKKPFIVSTRLGNITVHGTSFNVKAYSDEEYFEVTLVEGSVDIQQNDNKQTVRLKPHQHAYLENNQLKVKSIEPQYYTSWKDGKMIFNKEPFPSFIRKLERWYNIDIEYNDPKLEEMWYSGTIEMETVSEVMDLVSKAASISYSYDNTTRIFTLKSK